MRDNNLSAEDYKKIAELDELLKKDPNNIDFPNNIDLLMQRAFVFFDRYDDENAIKSYKDIIKKFPKYINAYLYLSYYLYRIACNIPEAIRVAKEGLKIDSSNAGFYTIIAFANAFYDYADKDEFLYSVKKAIELKPTWIWPRISLIEYLIKNKEYEQAKKEIYAALKQIQDDFPLPETDMGKFYEFNITGRAGGTKEILNDLLNKIPNKL